MVESAVPGEEVAGLPTDYNPWLAVDAHERRMYHAIWPIWFLNGVAGLTDQ